MEKKPFSLFWEYIKAYRAILLAALGCWAIAAIIFYLYSLPLEAVAYAFVLCFIFGFILWIRSFSKFVQKHKTLQDIKERITVELDPWTPGAVLPDRDYQEIITALYEHKQAIVAKNDSSRTEMMDYYTMWAHQIKTPIAAMDLLLRKEDSPQNTALGAELFKIEQYVDMVLSYLRLDSDSTDFIIAPCSLVKIVRSCIHKYARIFILKKIRLNFDEDEFYVLTDEKWLSFVIEQILSNALKYTKTGSITIRIDPARPSLIISDTGIGIRPEDLPRIFEKGFTGYNGRSGQKSSGLGLYLCRRILNKLSHTIEITSVPGEGTTVSIGLDTYKSVRFPGEM